MSQTKADYLIIGGGIAGAAIGYWLAPHAGGFFWAAGQGGYGIQSSAAASELYAAMLRGLPVPAHIDAFGAAPEQLGPARIR